MGLNESRMRAMLDPNSLADWNLNQEDRAAIQWALTMIDQQKRELNESRQELARIYIERTKASAEVKQLVASMTTAIGKL